MQKCEYCSKEFYANYSGRRFCSKKCRLKAGWNDKDPAKHSIFICAWCNKEFEEWTYRQPRFCSAQCRSEFGARQPKPRARKLESFIICQCEQCSKEYKIHKCIIEDPKRNTRFCSMKCRSAAKAGAMRGEGNPNWKGGFNPNHYGPNWGQQKRKAKKRDNHTCPVCGYRSGGNRILDVHHIKPLIEFNGDWEDANQLNNLIALCRPCHQKIECGKIPCPPLRQPR